MRRWAVVAVALAAFGAGLAQGRAGKDDPYLRYMESYFSLNKWVTKAIPSRDDGSIESDREIVEFCRQWVDKCSALADSVGRSIEEEDPSPRLIMAQVAAVINTLKARTYALTVGPAGRKCRRYCGGYLSTAVTNLREAQLATHNASFDTAMEQQGASAALKSKGEGAERF